MSSAQWIVAVRGVGGKEMVAHVCKTRAEAERLATYHREKGDEGVRIEKIGARQ